MIAWASLIGFALAFVLVAWATSLLAGGLVFAFDRRLAALGPAAERAAAATALSLAPLLAFVVVGALAAESLASGGVDHCGHHGDHLHLCLFHGGAWGDEPWALAALTLTVGLFAFRLGRAVLVSLDASRRLHRIARLSHRHEEGVLIAPAATPFCFVAGLGRPRIFISRVTWDALDDAQRHAVLAHERAHISGGDLGCAAAELLAAFAAPSMGRRLAARWADATERLRDNDAAALVGPAAVASALVALARLPMARPLVGLGAAAKSPDVLSARVEALLADQSPGTAAGQRIGRSALIGVALLAALAFAFLQPMHHAFESLLGRL